MSSQIKTDQLAIDELLTRSIDTIYPDRAALEALLKSGRQLRVYMGIDPTATYAHLGHATNYIILKRFHELGHKVIVLIGDFTAMIGDPSDKTAARQRLTPEQVKANLKTFKKQISKILNFKDTDNPIEFKFNSKWLSKLTFADAVELASHFTVQRMLERDNFERRIKENKPLYVHEFFYPLMQGYDSVAMNVDVEVGGTDQTFNMLAGRTLVKAYQNREKMVVTTTLLENPITGEKLMSKSLGTGIGLDEPPQDMYGKTMALPDAAIIQCFIDCTYLPMSEISQLDSQLKAGANPRDLKMRLAREIVSIYHSPAKAKKAERAFVRLFQQHQTPTEMPTVTVTQATQNVVDLFVNVGLVSNKSEARRLIEQKGLAIDDIIVTDAEAQITVKDGSVLRKGKRYFVKVVVK